MHKIYESIFKKVNHNKYIKILAEITLLSKAIGRSTPFNSGYRPGFEFDKRITLISGRIDLIDQELFEPGQTGIVKMTFNKNIIDDGYFKVGNVFKFYEGTYEIGEGKITEVISLNSDVPPYINS